MNITTSSSTCYHVLATAPPLLPTLSSVNLVNDASLSSYGILFTLSHPLDVENTDDIIISSIGFYVDNNKLTTHFESLPVSNQSISYQVYTLQGYYADPSRRGVELETNADNGGGLPVDSDWDYRGNATYWNLVAQGIFGMDDLIDNGIEYYLGNASYFQIPVDAFESVRIPSVDNFKNSGDGALTATVQSFYLTLKEVGALYQESLGNWESLNYAQRLLYCGLQPDGDNRLNNDGKSFDCENSNQYKDLPILQIGEGVVSYPFYTTPHFYKPRKFIGRIYIESNKCPTVSPALNPTNIPSPEERWVSSISLSPSIVKTASSESYIDVVSYGCHKFISTDQEYASFVNETGASYGIIVPIQTNEDDKDGVWITSIGFHVDFSPLVLSDEGRNNAIDYQLYRLVAEGYYADPNRVDGVPQDYDYRGNFTHWQLIASETISNSFFSSYNSNQSSSDGTKFYQIPWDRFTPTFIPPSGGVKSFYLTLSSGSLIHRELLRKQSIGKVQKDDNYQNKYNDLSHPPILMIGEGVIGYPFNTMPFLYSAKQFVGKIYYETACPSDSPSSTSEPSIASTFIPLIGSSIQPSISIKTHGSTSSSLFGCSVSKWLHFSFIVAIIS